MLKAQTNMLIVSMIQELVLARTILVLDEKATLSSGLLLFLSLKLVILILFQAAGVCKSRGGAAHTRVCALAHPEPHIHTSVCIGPPWTMKSVLLYMFISHIQLVVGEYEWKVGNYLFYNFGCMVCKLLRLLLWLLVHSIWSKGILSCI